MNFVSQLGNSVVYNLHQATYNPEAEAYSKEQAEKAATDAKVKADQAEKEKKAKEEAKAAAAAVAAKEEEQARKTFSPARLFYKIMVYAIYTAVILGVLSIGFLGASYATNLNVYQSWQAQLWCAIYGFLFSIPVVLYSCYRWFNGHVDPYFGVLPLFKSTEASETMRRYFGFLVFEPTAQVEQLKEWT